MRNGMDVAITGLGIVSGSALGAEAFRSNLLTGNSAFTLEAGYAEEPVPLGKVTPDLSPLLSQEVRARAARCVHLGLPAAQQALAQAGLSLPETTTAQSKVMGICIGSGLGGLDFHEEMIAKAIRDGMRGIHPFTIPKVMPSALGAWIAQQTGITGPNLCISTACSSGANAVAEAYWKIRTGQWDLALVGGAEAPLSPYTYHAYLQMRVISKSRDASRPCRPFHPDRDGFILAEGAGFLVMESAASAASRNAEVLAWVAGVAQNNGAYHPVAPRPDATDLVAVMQEALTRASLRAEEIDALCVHGTGTIKNDEVEYLGMSRVFGSPLSHLPLFAPKSQIGHTLGASGTLEGVACVQALMTQTIPQAFFLGEGMQSSEIVNRQGEYRYIMKNAFGFGSNNVSLIFRAR
jgi:3-oxoacyl-[acyl-carrier-protein] synthase II